MRFRVALVLAILADALQLAVFPLFVKAASRPPMTCSIYVGAVLVYLLGWHWGISSIGCRKAHSRRRPGSLLDARQYKRLPQIQAEAGSH